MKHSLLRVPKVGFPSRGNTKKVLRCDPKPQRNPNSKDLDHSPFFSSSQHLSPISITANDRLATSSVISASGELDEVESNFPDLSLLFDNSSDPSALPEFAPSPLVEKIVGGGASCVEGNPNSEDLDHLPLISISADDSLASLSNSVISASSEIDDVKSNHSELSLSNWIWTESSEVTAQPEGQIIAENWSEKDEGVRVLDEVIPELSKAVEGLGDAIRAATELWKTQWTRHISLSRLGQTTLAFFIGILLAFLLLILVAPDGCLIWKKLLEFNRPAPT